MKKLCILALALSGCASVSDISPIGKDTYLVDSTVMGGMTNWGDVKSMTLGKANDYCSGLGKKLVMSKMEEHGARGWTPIGTQITFKCLLETDPEYQKASN